MLSYKVIIPFDLNPYPENYEVTAAALLARYFQANVTFVKRANYQTPDFIISGVLWELKSPTGNGKRTAQRNLQAALKQAENIVYDGRRSKMDQTKLRRELQHQYTKTFRMKRLVLITKTVKVLEFKR
jgi:hypothetical protein